MHRAFDLFEWTKIMAWVARLAQSVEHETLNLGVVGSSPTLGVYFESKLITKKRRLSSLNANWSAPSLPSSNSGRILPDIRIKTKL